MSELSDGEVIVKMFRQVRSFSKQISLLLQTADSEMAKSGWEPKNRYADCQYFMEC